ncbi:AAA family ATPase [Allochromatium palmeri]|uniref:AAA family ATPase n=1 Tax=Allochromatium palmeri TaxID=231048 RepID=A0A6N8EFK5_9GAMM|nr:AAA family ATPase [Allochromatium palmeri]MTW21327.1 AAA family ATPase [Allochromatium palmeri]
MIGTLHFGWTLHAEEISPFIYVWLWYEATVATLYLEPKFNTLCGFTESEVTTVLERLAAEGAGASAWTPADALNTMRTFYNGYRFSEDAETSVYNPTLTLYFLKALQEVGRPRPLCRTPARDLAARPAVAARLDEAAEQARRYGATLRKRYDLTDLRILAVVAIGLERLVWRVL